MHHLFLKRKQWTDELHIMCNSSVKYDRGIEFKERDYEKNFNKFTGKAFDRHCDRYRVGAVIACVGYGCDRFTQKYFRADY